MLCNFYFIMVFSQTSLFLLLSFSFQAVSMLQAKQKHLLIRKKREWILPPINMTENVDYTHSKFIARIRSDSSDTKKVEYYLEGKGANESPFHVFVVDRIEGEVRVTKILDREEIDTYKLTGFAKLADGTLAEEPLALRINVIDENDNDPVFPVIKPVNLNELSPKGTSVMTIKATDADEEGNPNSQIAYYLTEQTPNDDYFGMHINGTIYVKKSTLDRETCAKYVIKVLARDLNGIPGGRSATSSVTINILDVNDNAPTLEKDAYEGSVEENTYGVEVMRIKAIDLDQDSDNWLAEFDIVQGNEAGYFSIKTDPETNEGILMLEKPLDYEDLQNLDLGIAVRNKAPLIDDGDGDASTINSGGGGGNNIDGGIGVPGGIPGDNTGFNSGVKPGGAGPGSGGTGVGGGGGGSGSAGTGVGSGSGGSGSGGTGGSGSGGTGSGGSGSGGIGVGTGSGGSGSGGTGVGTGSGGTAGGVLHGSSGAGYGSTTSQKGRVKTYPIKINVKNQPEGPRFDPKVKAIPISEGGNTVKIKEVIGSYPALDSDTGKPADNVRYAKGFDPDNWLTIDPKTAQISLNKIPDRESPFLVNGTYTAKIFCISEDIPAKTATGTIAIQVEDFNDHCPEVTSKIHTICTTQNSVIVMAKDEDADPNGAPFDFIIVPEGTMEKWHVEHLNETAAIVRAENSLWPGVYTVELKIMDQQGEACSDPQRVTVNVCTCEDGVICGKTGAHSSATFGPAGIGLLLLGLLLLLLIPLMACFCKCGGASSFKGMFAEMPFDTKSRLIHYHTEGQGDNTDAPTLKTPLQMGQVHHVVAHERNFKMQQSVASMNLMNGGGFQDVYTSDKKDGMFGMSQWEESGMYTDSMEVGPRGGIYDGIALPDYFLGEYYTQMAQKEDDYQTGKDCLCVHGYEGEGSPAGSVGCCSLLDSDNDLQFLNDLGMKFKTLADICGGEKVEKNMSAPVNVMSTPLPSVSATTTKILESRLETGHRLPSPPMPKPTFTKSEQTIAREVVDHSQAFRESKGAVMQGTRSTGVEMVNQQLLLQQPQPVYYTTTPVLQPMHYVVQPQFQSAVILAEAPATNLQDMVLVRTTEAVPSQSVIVQGQTLMSSGQVQAPGPLLVDNRAFHGSYSNLIQTGNLFGSQPMIAVEGRAPKSSMKTVKGMKKGHVQEGSLQLGELSGSFRLEAHQTIPEAKSLFQNCEGSAVQRVLSTQPIFH